MKRSTHPTEPELIGWRESALPRFRHAVVRRHLARCAACRAWVDRYAAITSQLERCLPTPEPGRFLDRAILDAAHAVSRQVGARPEAWRMLLRPAAALAVTGLAVGLSLWLRSLPTRPSPAEGADVPAIVADTTGSVLWEDPLTRDLDDQIEELELLINLAQEELYASNTALLPAPEEDLNGDLEHEINTLFQELEQEG